MPAPSLSASSAFLIAQNTDNPILALENENDRRIHIAAPVAISQADGYAGEEEVFPEPTGH